MRHFLAAAGLIAFAAIASPVQAAPASLDSQVASLPDAELAYAKKGGKGWKMGKKMKRGGPPYWAPAHGLRRKRGW